MVGSSQHLAQILVKTKNDVTTSAWGSFARHLSTSFFSLPKVHFHVLSYWLSWELWFRSHQQGKATQFVWRVCIWLNVNWEVVFFSTLLWPAILYAHINTWWSHWGEGRRLCEAYWVQTLWRQKAEPETQFLNFSWKHHNRLMFIPSHTK